MVYVSSTFDDLKSERELLIRDLVDAGHLPVHSYSTSSEPLVDACLEEVGKSDIYLLLLGRRYGHRPPLGNPNNLSITQLEFEAAVKLDKPLVVLEQANPPIKLSDADQGRDDDDRSRKLFWQAVDQHARRALWRDEASLSKAVLNGVTAELKRQRDKAGDDAPPIAPGATPPHARLLSRSLLLVHLAGPDDALAARLAGTLAQPEIGWAVETWRWNVEDGIDWRGFDQAMSRSRALAVLLTDSAPRFGADPALLREVVAFARRQCGFAAGFHVGIVAAGLPWLATLELDQSHRIDDWAAGSGGAVTADLALATRAMLGRQRDILDGRLVGLQCIVVAMTRSEAEALRDDPSLRDELNGEQRRFLADALTRAAAAGINWVARYGPLREDWQPFGPRDGVALPALGVLREVVNDINGQEVVPRRDQEALRRHRIRLRPYDFDAVVAGEPRALQLLSQVVARRLLVLVDELSLCHPKVRAAAADTLADPLLAVATVAPFDPPSLPVEAALKANGNVLQLGDLKKRFLVLMDPNCELNLASAARLMRWLRLSIPETLAGQAGVALAENRTQFLSEMDLRR